MITERPRKDPESDPGFKGRLADRLEGRRVVGTGGRGSNVIRGGSRQGPQG